MQILFEYFKFTKEFAELFHAGVYTDFDYLNKEHCELAKILIDTSSVSTAIKTDDYDLVVVTIGEEHYALNINFEYYCLLVPHESSSTILKKWLN